MRFRPFLACLMLSAAPALALEPGSYVMSGAPLAFNKLAGRYVQLQVGETDIRVGFQLQAPVPPDGCEAYRFCAAYWDGLVLDYREGADRALRLAGRRITRDDPPSPHALRTEDPSADQKLLYSPITYSLQGAKVTDGDAPGDLILTTPDATVGLLPMNRTRLAEMVAWTRAANVTVPALNGCEIAQFSHLSGGPDTEVFRNALGIYALRDALTNPDPTPAPPASEVLDAQADAAALPAPEATPPEGTAPEVAPAPSQADAAPEADTPDAETAPEDTEAPEQGVTEETAQDNNAPADPEAALPQEDAKRLRAGGTLLDLWLKLARRNPDLTPAALRASAGDALEEAGDGLPRQLSQAMLDPMFWNRVVDAAHYDAILQDIPHDERPARLCADITLGVK